MQKLSRRTFASAAAGGIASVAFVRKPARAATVTWKWATDLPPGHSICVRSVEAFGNIRNDTNGQFDIQAFPNGALGSNTGMVQLMRSGAVEMIASGATAVESMVTIGGIENVAFAFPTRKAALAAADGDLGNLFRDQAQTHGILVSDHVFDLGYRQFTTSTHPIRTVTDLDGLKLRVSPGKIRTDTFKSLGCSPITIEPTELYISLQTHIADGMESAFSVIESYRVFEVQRYCSLTNHMWSGYWTMTNLEKWNALSPDFQRILRKRLNEAAFLQRRDNELADVSLEDKLHRQGLTFNTTVPDSFRARLTTNGYYTRWRAEFGDAAWSALEKYGGKLS